MNFLTKARNAIAAFRHGGSPLAMTQLMRRTQFDYAREVGDGLDASVITAPVQWLQRSLPEARLKVEKTKRDSSTEEQRTHPMTALIRRPNPHYGDIALWAGTVLSYCLDGNAYWYKVRSRAGSVVELWWIPNWMIEPKYPVDGSEFISHYRYAPGNGAAPIAIDPADIVHFRHGIDPHNTRKGLSPLRGVLREVFIDLESSNFSAALLKNYGAPGVVISPKSGVVAVGDDVKATESWFRQKYSGDGRGLPLVMGGPTDVQAFGFNPQQMETGGARDVAEERVCACLGVPAAVVGFGAGLQATKVGATMTEMRKLAWTNGVLPLARSLADEINRSLLPEWGDARMLEAVWDTDEVLALQEDEDQKTERWGKRLASGGITVFEYRTALGMKADDSHRFYLRPIAAIEVPEDAPIGDGREGGEPESTKGTKAKGDEDDEASPDYVPPGPRASREAYERGERFALLLRRKERGQIKRFGNVLGGLFAKWSAETKDAAEKALAGADLPDAGKAKGDGADDLGGDAALKKLAERVLKALAIDIWREELVKAFEAQFLKVAEEVAEAGELAGIGTNLPDPVARAIVGTGGTRVGLIDLDKQTRDAVFSALAEARSLGEGVDQMAARIAADVGSGPWEDTLTRARMIARTETKFAQNISTIQKAADAGVEKLIVFDGRFGPPRSEDTHIARDGKIVDAATAATMAANMRPNCTLSFAPYFE